MSLKDPMRSHMISSGLSDTISREISAEILTRDRIKWSSIFKIIIYQFIEHFMLYLKIYINSVVLSIMANLSITKGC